MKNSKQHLTDAFSSLQDAQINLRHALDNSEKLNNTESLFLYFKINIFQQNTTINPYLCVIISLLIIKYYFYLQIYIEDIVFLFYRKEVNLSLVCREICIGHNLNCR